jgi:hypothetical protein
MEAAGLTLARKRDLHRRALRLDSVGALLMLPVILWQGWETLEEARERDE